MHHHAINACAQILGIQCNLAAPFGVDDDVPKLLSAALNVHAPQHSKWKPNRVKAWLADSVVHTMDVQMVSEVDPSGEMLGWLNEVNRMLAPPAMLAVG